MEVLKILTVSVDFSTTFWKDSLASPNSAHEPGTHAYFQILAQIFAKITKI